jgi:creatinine amidohydrolase/Fe(II)-dependent formamide hydrolase-like protein
MHFRGALMRAAICSLVAVLVLASHAEAQIRHVTTMTAAQLRAMDHEKTAVLLAGGILEEHGPFLPTFSDGYQADYLVRAVAEAIVARPGWTALIFPTIPLGHSGANDIGGRYTFPGTYAVRSTTMRAVFMDLADELGEQRFRWAFIIHPHGDPEHNRMLDQAAEYFTDTYGGHMVHLTGLMPVLEAEGPAAALTDAEQKETGLDIHAGTVETSQLLFLRSDLVDSAYREAPPQSGLEYPGLAAIGKRPDWNGYFGSPRLASAARGARIMQAQAARIVSLALDAVDGRDLARIPRYGDVAHSEPGNDDIDAAVLTHERRLADRQASWLRSKNLRP